MTPSSRGDDDAQPDEPLAAPLVGVFVGGRGERMGGVVKGLLRTPSGVTILDRLARVVKRAAPDAELVLVGAHDGLEGNGWSRLPDDPDGQGPLAGLSALLRAAAADGRSAIALASDLPFITPSLFTRLVREAETAPIYAPKLDGIFQPLFARYTPDIVLPAVGEVLRSPRKSLLAVFDRVTPVEMPVDADEAHALRDWDEPTDLPAPLRAQLPRKPR